MTYFKLTPEIHKNIADEYISSITTQQDLAKKYNVSTVMISNILKKFKIPTDHRRGFYNVDINYFKIIDTPNKSYFLGLFHADGSNSEEHNCVRISLQEKDKEILEKLKKDIKYSGPLYYLKKQGNRSNQFSLNIVAKELSQDLVILGYPKNKTYKVVFPEYLEQSLVRHFIRGLFDGDGCIHAKYKHSLSIVGTCNTLLGVKDYLQEILNINSVIVESKSKNIFRLSICKKIDIFNTLCHLYENSELYLQRKYDIFHQVYMIQKEHLYWQIYCKNLKTNEINIFKNMQETKEFFGLKSYAAISYCIHKSKTKIFRKTYYINLLKNE